MNKISKNNIGIILAVLCCGILIYAFESDRSFIQIFLAFVILFLPITFISSIKGKVAIFIFASFLIIGGYICFKLHWYDTGFGVVLAMLLGGATHIFRVSKATTFDATDYKQNQKLKHDGR